MKILDLLLFFLGVAIFSGFIYVISADFGYITISFITQFTFAITSFIVLLGGTIVFVGEYLLPKYSY